MKQGVDTVASGFTDAGNFVIDTANLIGDGFTDLGHNIGDAGKEIGHAVTDLGSSIGHAIGGKSMVRLGGWTGSRREVDMLVQPVNNRQIYRGIGYQNSCRSLEYTSIHTRHP